MTAKQNREFYIKQLKDGNDDNLRRAAILQVWFENCCEAVEYCISKRNFVTAEKYLIKVRRYLDEIKKFPIKVERNG